MRLPEEVPNADAGERQRGDDAACLLDPGDLPLDSDGAKRQAANDLSEIVR